MKTAPARQKQSRIERRGSPRPSRVRLAPCEGSARTWTRPRTVDEHITPDRLPHRDFERGVCSPPAGRRLDEEAGAARRVTQVEGEGLPVVARGLGWVRAPASQPSTVQVWATAQSDGAVQPAQPDTGTWPHCPPRPQESSVQGLSPRQASCPGTQRRTGCGSRPRVVRSVVGAERGRTVPASSDLTRSTSFVWSARQAASMACQEAPTGTPFAMRSTSDASGGSPDWRRRAEQATRVAPHAARARAAAGSRALSGATCSTRVDPRRR